MADNRQDLAKFQPNVRTPTFLDTAGTEMVDLYVGLDKTHFRVHKNMLCNKISYFNSMFKGGFEEASQSSATFPEDNPQSFDLLVGWVYSGSIRPLTGDPSAPRIASWDAIEFYALAEKICLLEVMDQVMDMIKAYYLEGSMIAAIWQAEKAYSLLQEGSPLRQFIAQCVVYAFLEISLPQGEELWPTAEILDLVASNKDFGGDFLKMIREHAHSGHKFFRDPTTAPKCVFHSHSKDEECPTRKKTMEN